MHGYYFELDWGIQHDRIPSLMYIQMYDPYDVIDLAPKGHVTVIAIGSFHACAFTYDFTSRDQPQQTTFDNRKAIKRYVRQRQVMNGTLRVEAQDVAFEEW